MRAIAEKDCRDDIMFLCRLSGRTMNKDTAISSSTRKLKVTFNKQCHDINIFENIDRIFWRVNTAPKPPNPTSAQRNWSPGQLSRHRRQCRSPALSQSYCRERREGWGKRVISDHLWHHTEHRRLRCQVKTCLISTRVFPGFPYAWKAAQKGTSVRKSVDLQMSGFYIEAI